MSERRSIRRRHYSITREPRTAALWIDRNEHRTQRRASENDGTGGSLEEGDYLAKQTRSRTLRDSNASLDRERIEWHAGEVAGSHGELSELASGTVASRFVAPP